MTSKYNTQVVPTATPARIGAASTPKRLMGFVLVGGSANSAVIFENADTDTGDTLMSANALANTSIEVDLTKLGGVWFSTGIYCKPTGTAAIAYVWYE